MGCAASNYIAEEDFKDGHHHHHHQQQQHRHHRRLLHGADVVLRCKERNLLMKNVVKGREEFAIAHTAYVQSLQNVGLALRRVSEGPHFSTHHGHDHGEVEEVQIEEDGGGEGGGGGGGGEGIQGFHSHRKGAGLLNESTDSSRRNAHFGPPEDAHFKQERTHFDQTEDACDSSSSLQAHHRVPTFPDSPSNSSSSSSSSSSSCSKRISDSTALNSRVREDVLPSASSACHADSSLSSSSPSSSSSSPSITKKDAEFRGVCEDKDDDDDDCHFVSSSNTPVRDPTSWFDYNIFDPPPIPYHLVEQRRIRSKKGGEEEIAGLDMAVDDKNYRMEESCGPVLNKGKEGLLYQYEKTEENSVKENNADEVAQEVDNVLLREHENAVALQEKEVKDMKRLSEGRGEQEREDNDKGREAGNELAMVARSSGETKDLICAVRHIHDHFTRASMSGKDVSCLLETQMVKHDDMRSKDSSKGFNAIIAHWSRKTSVAVRDACQDSNISECGMLGSQASTLERIYAWERKLYEEVKAGEAIRAVFDRKCQKLQRLSAKKTDQVCIDKLRASVKTLDTQLMVALQAIDFASSTIRRLTNEELYPQLAELLEGLMHMWRVMCECHRAQQCIASEMQIVDSRSMMEGVEGAIESHGRAISELERELGSWRACFQRWIESQKNYIFALNEWLSKCHVEPVEGKRGGVKPVIIVRGSSSKQPTILAVLNRWCASLEHLERVQSVVEAIGNFSNVVHFLRAAAADDDDADDGGGGGGGGGAVSDVKRIEAPFASALLSSSSSSSSSASSSSPSARNRKRLEYKEMNAVDSSSSQRSIGEIRLARAAHERNAKILSQFKEHLPYVFESMALFAKDALRKYESLQRENSSMPQEC